MINQEAVTRGPARRAQILDAALHVMAEHGFRGASIKRIAQRAGLKSPALIYWYFKDKQALLEAIFERMSPFLSTVAEADASLDEPPDQVLPRVVNSFLFVVQQPEYGRFVRIMLSEFARHPAVAGFFAERGPLLVLRFLERYFTRQIELGRLQPHDPGVAARAFMGMLLIYALGREIFPAVAAGFTSADAYGQQVTAIFLSGLAAPAAD
ncbi:MAG TPA: TetR/AcrR family transcriptional regulator [Chloroflexota bacterium]